MFRNIDRTYGSQSLKNIALELYESQDETEKYYTNHFVNLFKNNFKDDWLLNILSSYGRNQFSFGDIMYYKNLVTIISKGNLYMHLFRLDNYAFPDNEFENNLNNLKKIFNINISLEKKHNSDGLFEINQKLVFQKIYMSDEETPDNPEEIILENIFGICEFGTQDICKSVASLTIGDILLRVPYKSNVLSKLNSPVGAIFVNIKPNYLWNKKINLRK
jgi:hypothetical protein